MIDLQRAARIAEDRNFDPPQWRMLDSLISHHPVFEHLLWREANGRSSETYPLRPDTEITLDQLVNIVSLTEPALINDNDLAVTAASIERAENVCIGSLGTRFVTSLFYGNPRRNPAQFYGFSTYFNTLDPSLALNGANVIDGNGRGNNCFSVWFVCWGKGAYIAYPKHSEMGLLIERLTRSIRGPSDDHGRISRIVGFFGIRAALVIPDWRFVVRIANLSEQHTRDDVTALMDRAISLPPADRGSMCRFYMGTTMRNIWRGDENDMRHREIPIDCVDELSPSEDRVQGKCIDAG